ncbi:DUF2254 domain-containing protein [Streptomyces boninensis]|uniref:DUF2254 domain-containing protein n=1 Tax=Streptomyces boninensis TaxID=2039455 RepID=UPI003B213527
MSSEAAGLRPAERVRTPQRSYRGRRARQTRNRGIALLVVATLTFLGWALPVLEEHLPHRGLGFDASTAQATLAAIAGSMITLGGFVITVITLVIQTVQSMSHRLVGALGHLDHYLAIFGLLIGTALYALVALSRISGHTVPRLTVTVALGLVLIATVSLMFLLSSLRHAVTGGGLSRAVGDRLRTVIDRSYPAADTAPPPQALPPEEGVEVTVRHEGSPGVIRSLDEPRLVHLAAAASAQIEMALAVGEFAGSGVPLARITLPAAAAAEQARLAGKVAHCVRYGPNPTVEQDTSHGLRLLADISIRALSPAVNDPTTAVQALDQIEDVLLRLADRPLGPAWLLDGAGVPRVAYPAPGWADFVGLSLDETLLYGAGNPQVVRRLYTLLDRLSAAVPEHRRGPVEERRAALRRMADAGLPDALLRSAAGQPGAEPRP